MPEPRADAVIIALRLAEPHTNSRGLAHGGLITSLADNAMGLSCGHKLGDVRGCSRRRWRSISSARRKVGQWLSVETEVIKTGRTLCFAQCLVKADGVTVARANGSFSVVAAKD